jgi:fibronectin-binding autotransporter adhesin
VNIGSTPIEKTDSGTWTISSSGNTWGATAINSGTLLLGASSALPDASNLTMASSTTLGLAGTHSLGGSRTGTLLLSGNATIDFGSIGNTQALVFGDSSLLNWGSFALTINNWESGVDTLRFGGTSSGLTSSQLAGINFTGFTNGAQIDSMGFVTPIPEPSSLFLLSAGLAILALRRRKS